MIHDNGLVRLIEALERPCDPARFGHCAACVDHDEPWWHPLLLTDEQRETLAWRIVAARRAGPTR